MMKGSEAWSLCWVEVFVGGNRIGKVYMYLQVTYFSLRGPTVHQDSNSLNDMFKMFCSHVSWGWIAEFPELAS